MAEQGPHHNFWSNKISTLLIVRQQRVIWPEKLQANFKRQVSFV